MVKGLGLQYLYDYASLFSHCSGSVLCVGTAISGDVCFSADELGEVRIWQMPIEITDPFDAYGKHTQ